jgi:transposase InsO family protein
VELELKRRRWIVHKKLQGWKSQDIANHLGVSKSSVMRWWRAYNAKGWNALEIKSHKPHTIHRTDEQTIKLVCKLRERHGWGPCKIEGYLRQAKLKDITLIRHNTIYRILCSNNLNNSLDKPRKTWGKKRFSRLIPNALWQADWKLDEHDRWMITYLDDYSRYIVGSKKVDDATTENALKMLEKSARKHGLPEQILTDRGVQFYCVDKKGKKSAESEFTQWCTANDIQHIVASKRRPTTIGKVEAYHKAYVMEAYRFSTYDAWVRYWNNRRPHQGIGYYYPSDLYFERVSYLPG